MDISPLLSHDRWDGMSGHKVKMDCAHHTAAGVHLQDFYHRPGIRTKES
jgi:hypothetical protein